MASNVATGLPEGSTPSSSSSSAAPNPVLRPAKQKRPSADAQARIGRKRQKAKDVKAEEIQSASEQLVLLWRATAEAAASRRTQARSEPGSLLEILTKSWDVIRAADGRPALTAAQQLLIPRNQDLHSLLSHIFTSPFTWESANFPKVLQRREVLEEAVTNKVQYYIRRLHFEDHDQLKALFEKVSTSDPQYAGQIDILLSATKLLLGSFFVSYGGFTVSSSPVGRDLDDKEDDGIGGFLKTALEAHEGTRLVYEVLPLAFEIGAGGRDSVKLSRSDSRTSLYESLVIDSMGFLCFNTAAAGTVIESKPTVEFTAMKEAVQTRRVTAATSRKAFTWQIPAPASSSA